MGRYRAYPLRLGSPHGRLGSYYRLPSLTLTEFLLGVLTPALSLALSPIGNSKATG